MHPDGSIEIRSTEGKEAFYTAINFWFQTNPGPKVVILEIAEADPREVAILQKLNSGIGVMMTKVWTVSLEVDGGKVWRYLTGNEKPSHQEAMFYLMNDYRREQNKHEHIAEKTSEVDYCPECHELREHCTCID